MRASVHGAKGFVVQQARPAICSIVSSRTHSATALHLSLIICSPTSPTTAATAATAATATAASIAAATASASARHAGLCALYEPDTSTRSALSCANPLPTQRHTATRADFARRTRCPPSRRSACARRRGSKCQVRAQNRDTFSSAPIFFRMDSRSVSWEAGAPCLRGRGANARQAQTKRKKAAKTARKAVEAAVLGGRAAAADRPRQTASTAMVDVAVLQPVKFTRCPGAASLC